MRTTPANDANPFRYCGEYFDEETGFVYLRNRYYDSSIGRFITEDPIRDGLNWYAYCANNPVMFVDPLGLSGEKFNFFGTNLSKLAYSVVDNLYQDALDLTQTYIDEGKVFDDEYFEESKRINDEIDFVIDADLEGKVSGKVYDVPLYDQGTLPLCWAYCQVMVEAFLSETDIGQDAADKEAEKIAKSVHGKDWKKGGYPTNSRNVTTTLSGEQLGRAKRITSFCQIMDIIKWNPMYAIYQNDLIQEVHMVVITGAVSVKGENYVISNNPWGESNAQKFDDFLKGIPGDTHYGMEFLGIQVI